LLPTKDFVGQADDFIQFSAIELQLDEQVISLIQMHDGLVMLGLAKRGKFEIDTQKVLVKAVRVTRLAKAYHPLTAT
jgi:hypothetical protein